MQIEEGFPVLVTRRLAYDRLGTAVEFSKSIYRSDQYVMEVEYK